jgi:hypothetical protein
VKPASAKLVLLCLANCHNDGTGRCNPSVKFISEATGLDKKTIPVALDMLAEKGLIEFDKRRGATPNYRINFTRKRANSSPEIGATSEKETLPEIGATVYPKSGELEEVDEKPSLPEIGLSVYPKTGNGVYPKSGNKPGKNQERTGKGAAVRRTGKTKVPENFEVTDRMREWAAEKTPGIDVDAATEQWADYWRSTGKLMSDWEATWRNGMKLHVKWNQQDGAATGVHREIID